MLLPSFFIVEAEEFDKLSVVALPENTQIIYRIDADKLSESTFYKNLFKSNKQFPFCLLITINSEQEIRNNNLQKNLHALVAFTFHYKYLKSSFGHPLIIFQPKENVDTNEYITLVQQAFYNQGYENIDPLVAKNEQIFNWPGMEKKGLSLPLPALTDNISKEYLETLKATIGLTTHFFTVSAPEKLAAQLAILQKTETAFLQEHPQQYQLLKELDKLADQHKKLLINHGLLQEKLDSQARYNSFYKQADERYKKQILEIVEFYRKEYEILPLWFKQLGHVVKVITGKRTFKSLFNDNVKKYKD